MRKIKIHELLRQIKIYKLRKDGVNVCPDHGLITAARNARIREFAGSLEGRLRSDGSAFTVLKDGSPEWAYDIVRLCHNGALPCDCTYQMIHDVVLELAELIDDDLDIEDNLRERLDCICPGYPVDLIRWELNCAIADESIAEVIDEQLVDTAAADFSIHTLRAAGWMVAAEHIAHTIIAECDVVTG